MAYTLNRTLSFTAMRWYVVQVIGALEAAGFKDLAELWRQLREAVAGAEATYTADLEHELVTTAHVRVCDAAWDESVMQLSKKALFLAGGDANAEPYSKLFGTTKARDLQRLGPAKATLAGGELVSKVLSSRNAELAAAGQDLAAKTEALAVAEKADNDAERKLASHGFERTRTLQSIEALIAETQIKLLTRNPGRDDLVRAILSPNTGRRPAKKSEAEETPVDPEL